MENGETSLKISEFRFKRGLLSGDGFYTYRTMEKFSGQVPIPIGGLWNHCTWNADILFDPLRIRFKNGVTWMSRSPMLAELRMLRDKPHTILISYVVSDSLDLKINDKIIINFIPKRRLIISSGDISDIDGMYALSKYAVSGADVMFVMNYPAYIGVHQKGVDIMDQKGPSGLGYTYDTESFLAQFEKGMANENSTSNYVKYKQLLDVIYNHIADIPLRVKQIMTDLAFHMVSEIWDDVSFRYKGVLYFYVGGINDINPFSISSLKNEIFVYSDLVVDGRDAKASKMVKLARCDEGSCFYGSHNSGMSVGAPVSSNVFDMLGQHPEIYIDFNGSMAFFNGSWKNALEQCKNVVKGGFVMGGVYSYARPSTMPSIDNVLNRFSCATMNQLYHPLNTASFFETMRGLKCGVYIISNNAVGNQETVDATDKKTDVGWKKFLDANFQSGFFNSEQYAGETSILKKFAGVFYNCKYNPPRRAFDFYTATALVARMSFLEIGSDANLFFDDTFGVTLVSYCMDWSETVGMYSAYIDTFSEPGDAPFIVKKKHNFSIELGILKSRVACYPPLLIRNVEFETNASGVLRVRPSLQNQNFVIALSNVAIESARCIKRHGEIIEAISGLDLFGKPSQIQWPVVFRLSALFDILSITFINGTSMTANILPVSTVIWRMFIELHLQNPSGTTARVNTITESDFDVDLISKGHRLLDGNSDDITPFQHVTISFPF
jgi:hypothetical protein